MKVGDLFWLDLPARGGHAQSGRRPGIIVQGENASDSLPTVLVVPLTTQQDALRFPGTVLIEPDTDNGLKRASVALVFQLTTLDQRFVTEKIGYLSSESLQEVWESFDDITDRLDLE